MMNVKFIVEKGPEGYWAYREEPRNDLITTMADTLTELKDNIVEAYNLYQSENPKKQITREQIKLEFDLPSFFELYSGVITATGIGKRIGMQKTLISAYVNGKKRPSENQVKKILLAVKELGRELADLEIA
jgi:hypothetical protein